MQTKRIPASAVLAGVLAVPPGTQADMIDLSTHSSDETPVSSLLASIDFSVTGQTLSVAVVNRTAAPNDYRIGEIFFNLPAALSDLALASPVPGWSLLTSRRAGGFGTFDVSLRGGVGNDPHQIVAGQTMTFTLDFSGTAAGSDFLAGLSTTSSGNPGAIVAAKFTGGPGDDSAFGGTLTVPAPATALLLIGHLTLARRRRA